MDPFTSFLQHQNEMLVLMATGGLLTSLTGATGLGDGTSNAHEATWDSIVGRDAVVVGDAINRGVATSILNAAFPGRPHLAQFILEREEAPTPTEVFEAAGKAYTAGYLVDKAQLEERSGFKLEKIEVQAPMGGYSSVMNSETAVVERSRKAGGDSRHGEAGENGLKAVDAPTGGLKDEKAVERILEGFADTIEKMMGEEVTKTK